MVDQRSGRTTRYRFHEIVRQYARKKLNETGEEDEVRTRHLKYFLQLSREAEPSLKGPTQIEVWMARLNEERDNLRAALRWADKTDLEAGLYISGRLQGFWENLNVDEGDALDDKVSPEARGTRVSSRQGQSLVCAGGASALVRGFTEATWVAQECLTLFRACGDQQGEADALILLGYDLQYLDKREAADELYEQSLALARSLGDARRQALALFRLGYDHPDRQIVYWEKAIDLFRQVDDRSSMASLLCATARFRILLTGDIETAQKDLDEALQYGPVRGRNIGGLWEEASFAKSLIALMRGDYEEAAALLEEIVILAQDRGNRMGYLWTRVQLGHIALRAGDLTEARATLAETAQTFHKDNSTIGVVYTLEGLAGLSVAVGKPEHAANLIGWTDATREQIINPRPFLEQANVDRDISAIMAKIGSSAFEVAYDSGREMLLDKAVALALNL